MLSEIYFNQLSTFTAELWSALTSRLLKLETCPFGFKLSIYVLKWLCKKRIGPNGFSMKCFHPYSVALYVHFRQIHELMKCKYKKKITPKCRQCQQSIQFLSKASILNSVVSSDNTRGQDWSYWGMYLDCGTCYLFSPINRDYIK